jgi:hypothetical protein
MPMTKRRRRVAGVAALSLLLAMTACTRGRPDRVVEPETIGIISSAETSEDGITRTLALENGQEIVVRTRGDIIVAGSTFAGPDDLLVTGMLDDARWHLTSGEGDPESQLVPDGCYVYAIARTTTMGR